MGQILALIHLGQTLGSLLGSRHPLSFPHSRHRQTSQGLVMVQMLIHMCQMLVLIHPEQMLTLIHIH